MTPVILPEEYKPYPPASIPGGFHWRDGWYFARMLDGSVEVRYESTAHLYTTDSPTVTIRFTIPPAEWASIVSSVSKDGETYDRWMAAQVFHGANIK